MFHRHCVLQTLAGLFLIAALATSGFAKENQQTQTFTPSVNSKGLAVTEHGDILPHLKWSAGFIYNWAYKPVVVYDRNTGDELGTVVAFDHAGNTADLH